MSLVHERTWTPKDRTAWWVKYLVALGTGMAGVQGAQEIVAAYLDQSGVETIERAKREHEAIEAETDQKVARIEAKLDQIILRVDGLYSRPAP